MKNILLSLCMASFLLPLQAQYITVRETDQAGHTMDLVSARQAVDINSRLHLTILQPAIISDVHDEMQKRGEKSIDSLIETLTLYKEYLQKLDQAVQAYQQLFRDPEGTIEISVLRTALQQRARAGIAIVRLFPEGSRFSRRREEELILLEPNKGSNESYRILMRLLGEEMTYIEEDLQRLRREAGYAFQLGAWVVTARGKEPVHLEGFDMLPEGEFYEYERNRLYLTQEQRQELNALSDFFEGLDKQNVFDKIADILPGLAAAVIDTSVIQWQFRVLRDQAMGLVTTLTEEKNNVIQNINSLETSWKTLQHDLKTLYEKYSSSAGLAGATSKVEALRGFMDDFSTVSQRFTALGEQARSVITDIQVEALGTGAVTLKEEAATLVSVCLDAANDIVNHAREGYYTAVYGRRINAAALELSDQVLKLGIDNIPSSTSLDLRYTGKREPGDLLVFKAFLRKGDDVRAFKTEAYEYPMMNALPHLHMSVAYAYARPVIKDQRFKGGPLVSVLYKFKSRSLPYRNFFDPGIGLHAASFDFNSDDTPEFAGGVVVSLFKDYLQGGWGFNFNAGLGYWFAGIRIPLPTTPVTLVGQ